MLCHLEAAHEVAVIDLAACSARVVDVGIAVAVEVADYLTAFLSALETESVACEGFVEEGGVIVVVVEEEGVPVISVVAVSGHEIVEIAVFVEVSDVRCRAAERHEGGSVGCGVDKFLAVLVDVDFGCVAPLVYAVPVVVGPAVADDVEPAVIVEVGEMHVAAHGEEIALELLLLYNDVVVLVLDLLGPYTTLGLGNLHVLEGACAPEVAVERHGAAGIVVLALEVCSRYDEIDIAVAVIVADCNRVVGCIVVGLHHGEGCVCYKLELALAEILVKQQIAGLLLVIVCEDVPLVLAEEEQVEQSVVVIVDGGILVLRRAAHAVVAPYAVVCCLGLAGLLVDILALGIVIAVDGEGAVAVVDAEILLDLPPPAYGVVETVVALAAIEDVETVIACEVAHAGGGAVCCPEVSRILLEGCLCCRGHCHGEQAEGDDWGKFLHRADGFIDLSLFSGFMVAGLAADVAKFRFSVVPVKNDYAKIFKIWRNHISLEHLFYFST